MPSPPPAVIADRDSGGLKHLMNMIEHERSHTHRALSLARHWSLRGTGPTHTYYVTTVSQTHRTLLGRSATCGRRVQVTWRARVVGKEFRVYSSLTRQTGQDE